MGTTKSVTTHVGAKGACHFEAELKGNRLLSFIGICVKGEGHCICEMSFGDIVELRDALNIAIGWDERSSDIPGKTKMCFVMGVSKSITIEGGYFPVRGEVEGRGYARFSLLGRGRSGSCHHVGRGEQGSSRGAGYGSRVGEAEGKQTLYGAGA